MTSVSLIHVAVAADNKHVVKYLMNKDKQQIFKKTGVVRHSPLTLAVLKDSTKVLKFTHNVCKSEKDHFRQDILNNFQMELAKRGENGEVKRFSRSRYQFCNPGAWCFLLGAVPSAKTIQQTFHLLEDENIAGVLKHVIYAHDRAISLGIIEGFSRSLSVFPRELVLEAIIWNKPEVLKTLLRKWIAECLVYNKNELLHVCKFLGHSECSVVIQQTFDEKLWNKNPRKYKKYKQRQITYDVWERQCSFGSFYDFLSANVSPYTFILNFYSRHSYMYDGERICTLLYNISKKHFYSPNEKDKYGMTCLHYALEHLEDDDHLTAFINTLCRIGCDCNAEDINGRSALFIALTPYNSPLGMPEGHHRRTD